MEQKINATGSQDIQVIQAGGDVYYTVRTKVCPDIGNYTACGFVHLMNLYMISMISKFSVMSEESSSR